METQRRYNTTAVKRGGWFSETEGPEKRVFILLVLTTLAVALAIIIQNDSDIYQTNTKAAASSSSPTPTIAISPTPSPQPTAIPTPTTAPTVAPTSFVQICNTDSDCNKNGSLCPDNTTCKWMLCVDGQCRRPSELQN